jgi:PAS domain S-box-containing protein
LITKLSTATTIPTIPTIERRRPRPAHQSPIDELQRMSALVVLERLPAPALAVDRDGTVLFANRSFCDMMGYSTDELYSMKFDDFFCSLPADDRWIALVGVFERLVELRHKCRYSVWASMSKSAMRRRDDTVALVSFHDRTEELWHNGVEPPYDTCRPTRLANWAR